MYHWNKDVQARHLQKRWASQPAPGIRLVPFLQNWFFFFFHECYIPLQQPQFYIYNKKRTWLKTHCNISAGPFKSGSVSSGHASVLATGHIYEGGTSRLFATPTLEETKEYSNDQCKCNWKSVSFSFEPNIRAWGGSQSLAELSTGIMLLVPNQHCLNYAHRSDAPRLFSYDRANWWAPYPEERSTRSCISASNVHIINKCACSMPLILV